MTAFRFTTTRLSGLQAAGRVQDLQYSVIAPLLERELGADFGRLFADFEMESADVRSWYVDSDARPVRIGDLAPDRQAALRTRLAGMIARISELSGALEKESSQRAHLSRVLKAATTFPADDIWALGDEPLIVNWGFHPRDVPAGTPQAVLELIRRPKPVEEPPRATVTTNVAEDPKPDPVTPPVARPPRIPWRIPWRLSWRISGAWLPALLWTLFAVLALGCLWQMLPACTDWPVLSALKTCRSDARLHREAQRLEALVRAEQARHAPCPQAVTGEQGPPAAVVEANQRVPSGPDDQRDIIVAWDGHARLGLGFKCPEGPKGLSGGVGNTVCGIRIVAEANRPSDTLVDKPVDRAVLTSWPRGEFQIGVVLESWNDVPPGTPVSFVLLRRTGHNVTYGVGTLDKLGETYTVTLPRGEF